LKGENLKDRCKELASIEWGGNTNLVATFDLLLLNNELPKVIFIFSDMQFDKACVDPEKTNLQSIREKFNSLSEFPEIIFWNLRATDQPELPVNHNDKGLCLLSGFNVNILHCLLEGKQYTSVDIMNKALEDPFYNKLTI
jgi:hypothetical protein